MERVKGIEPSCSAWEADVLPLNYTRTSTIIIFNSQVNYKIILACSGPMRIP